MPNTILRQVIVSIGALACVALMAGCGKPAAKPAAPASSAASAMAGYAAPPELLSAQHSAAGGVELKGVSRPDAQIRLLAPDGTGPSTIADHGGAWEMRGPSTDPRLFALSEAVPGRIIRSRGYVAILPPPGVAAIVLRPGAGPRALGGPRAVPVIVAVDFDRAGAGVVSGLAGVGKTLRVQVDGHDAGEGRSNQGGAFSISLSDVLKPGAHTAVVHLTGEPAPARSAAVAFDVAPPPASFPPPLLAQRLDTGWRLDWVTPGGGVQTTLVFDTEPRA